MVRLVGAHNALGAVMAEHAGFDGVWSSSLEISASHAVPDASILGKSEHLAVARAMCKAVQAPVVADCDTGYGDGVQFATKPQLAENMIGRAVKGSLRTMRPDDLAAAMIRAALSQVPALDPHTIDDIMLGCAQPAGEQGYGLARVVATMLGLDDVPGTVSQRYCASSVQTSRMAMHAIKAGEAQVLIDTYAANGIADSFRVTETSTVGTLDFTLSTDSTTGALPADSSLPTGVLNLGAFTATPSAAGRIAGESRCAPA